MTMNTIVPSRAEIKSQMNKLRFGKNGLALERQDAAIDRYLNEAISDGWHAYSFLNVKNNGCRNEFINGCITSGIETIREKMQTSVRRNADKKYGPKDAQKVRNWIAGSIFFGENGLNKLILTDKSRVCAAGGLEFLAAAMKQTIFLGYWEYPNPATYKMSTVDGQTAYKKSYAIASHLHEMREDFINKVGDLQRTAADAHAAGERLLEASFGNPCCDTQSALYRRRPVSMILEGSDDYDD